MKVIYIVNSFINRPGNIGLRIGKILNSRASNEFQSVVFARGGNKVLCSMYKMGVFGHIPRIMNAIRMYVYSRFKFRLYDIKLFELFFLLFYPKLKLEINNYSNAKVVVHITETSPKIIERLKLLGCKIVLDVPIAPSSYRERLLKETGNTFGLDSTRYLKEYEIQSFILADSISVPSLFVKSELCSIGVDDSKIKIIPFGVDNVCVKNGKKLIGQINYCFAGVINCRKGIQFLLDAWDSPEFEDDKLHLCGRLTPEIKKIIKDKKLSNIILPGFVNTTEYFEKCDVYVFPSLLEGSSKSIYEAMKSGMPVITTFESGSIIRDRIDGFIISKCSSQEIKEKMLYFKNNQKSIVRMGESAQDRVSQYTWGRYSDEYLKLYQSLSESD